MSRRQQTAKGKSRKVGFALQGTKIEPIDSSGAGQALLNRGQQRGSQARASQLEFHVAKAKEFETFKQIPKFSHTPLAVIHPSPQKPILKHRHQAPSSLAFDSSPLRLAARRYEQKQLPEHLVRPPIDQDKLMKVRENSLLRMQGTKSTKKTSLASQKAEQAVAKQKSEINLKIKRSEKNMKALFEALKKLLDKPDDDIIFPNSVATVERAKAAARAGRYVSFVFAAYSELQGHTGNYDEKRVSRAEFVLFVKFILFGQPMYETVVSDMFMHASKKLSQMLQQLSSANQSKADDTLSLDRSGGNISPARKSDLDGVGGQGPDKNKMTPYGISVAELNAMRLDFSGLDAQYHKWAEEDDSLSGVLNAKITKQKNQELRDKIKAWKARTNERKVVKKRTFDHGKLLREFFSKQLENFSFDRERVQECIYKYNSFAEDMLVIQKDNKIINNFLSELPEASHHIMQVEELNSMLKVEQQKITKKHQLLEEFIQTIKQECVMNQHYFSFFDIPDLIVKKSYSRKDYEESLLKVLTKVKTRYLAEKVRELPDKSIDQIQITDDDLVPLELLDWVMGTIQNKASERIQTIVAFIKASQQAVAAVQQKLNLDSDKTKKIVEQNVIVSHINQIMEQEHLKYYRNDFIHRNLYIIFVRQSNSAASHSAKELESQFLEVFKAEQSSNKYYQEYKRKLDTEMQKFTGKLQAGEGTETASEMTSGTKITRKSGQSPQKLKQGGQMDSVGKADELDEAATLAGAEGTINDRDNNFDLNPHQTQQNALEQEDALELERQQQENNKLKNAGDSQYKEFYRDPADGTLYNPKKKFGIIEDEALIYDNISSSYPVILPPEYYQKYIMENVPKKEHGNGKWFIRPHHLETLTQHPSSVKDGVLNTRYFSHYDQNFGKKVEEDKNETALQNIEQHLESLRSNLRALMMRRGEDPEKLEEMRESCKREALFKYEQFISDKTRFNNKELIVDAYEGILLHNRTNEKDILNKQRFTEYEKNRPPQDNWYEMKSAGFQKELYRNRVALKPNNSNDVYLENLMDKHLY